MKKLTQTCTIKITSNVREIRYTKSVLEQFKRFFMQIRGKHWTFMGVTAIKAYNMQSQSTGTG